MYLKKIQITLLKLLYQTDPKYPKTYMTMHFKGPMRGYCKHEGTMISNMT